MTFDPIYVTHNKIEYMRSTHKNEHNVQDFSLSNSNLYFTNYSM